MSDITGSKSLFGERLRRFVKEKVALDPSSHNWDQKYGQSNTDTDILIIGSSMVHLARALALASFGARVTVLEQREQLGGVWSTTNTVGLSNVERAPHIFMPCEIAYSFIEEVIGIELVEVEPQPFILTVGKNGKIESQNPFPNTEITTHPQVRYSGQCRHPREGTNALLNRLIELGKDLDVTFKVNTFVDALEVNNDTVTAKGEFGKVSGRRAVISRGSPVVQLDDSEAVILPYKSSSNVSLHFLIESTAGQTFSFVHVDGHPLIKEIHDVSTSTKEIKTGQRLIIVKLRYNIFENNELPLIDSTNVFDDLVRLDLFGLGDRIITSQVTGYAQTRLTEIGVRHLEQRYGDRIEIVPFANLSNLDIRADLCAQDMSVAFSAPEFYQTLLRC